MKKVGPSCVLYYNEGVSLFSRHHEGKPISRFFQVQSELDRMQYNELWNVQNILFFQQNSNVMDYLKRGNRMEPPEGCPASVNEIMQSTWNWDPNKRPTFQELLLKLCKLAETELKSWVAQLWNSKFKSLFWMYSTYETWSFMLQTKTEKLANEIMG